MLKRLQRSPGTGCFQAALLLAAIVDGRLSAEHPAPHAARCYAICINAIDMKLVLIPAGEFQMGTHETPAQIKAAFPADYHEPDFFRDESPRHTVRITRPFLMGQTEVTVGQFRRFVCETGYCVESESDGEGGWGFNAQTRFCEGRSPKYSWHDPGFPQTDCHPVTNVTWHDAVAFCDWLTRKTGQRYRLPTEAEWEYACRAGSTGRYSDFEDPSRVHMMSRTLDSRLLENFSHVQEIRIPDDGSIPFTAAVGSFPANAFGLYDMHGNVWEWTTDWYGEDYYTNSPRDNPPGPLTGDTKVRRGGGWNSFPIWARASFRNWNSPRSRCLNLGFRIAAEITPAESRGPTCAETRCTATLISQSFQSCYRLDGRQRFLTLMGGLDE